MENVVAIKPNRLTGYKNQIDFAKIKFTNIGAGNRSIFLGNLKK